MQTKLNPLIMLIIAAMVQTIHAQQKTLAVLEITPKSIEVSVSIAEMQHITDELRRQATLALPQNDYKVLTRDNIIKLIPQDEKEADRLIEGGAVVIGKAIEAEYVSQGSISRFGNEISLSLELYQTETDRLIGSIVIERPDVKELLLAIREQAPAFFAKITNSTTITPPPTEPTPPKEIEIAQPQETPQPIQTSIPTQIPSEKTTFWTNKNIFRAAMFGLSAASVGIGIWHNSKIDSRSERMDKSYDATIEARGTPNFNTKRAEFIKSKDDVKSSQYARNGFYIGAGVLCVAGGVSFIF